MAIAIASKATGSAGSGNPAYSTVIAKPSSLAVGDLMVAFIHNLGSSVTTPSTVPSGFTLIRSQNHGFGTTSNISSYYKVADSGDVAASSFTWGCSVTGGGVIIGELFRITGSTNTIDKSDSNNQGNTSSPGFSGDNLGPSYPNSLFLFDLGVHVTSGSADVNSYAMVTSNPTWTEEVEDGTGSIHFAIASAIRPETTATGNWSASISGGGNYYVGCMGVVITAKVDATPAPSAIGLSSTVPTPTVKQGQTASPSVITMSTVINSPTVTKKPTWVNEDKASAPNWVNEDKS